MEHWQFLIQKQGDRSWHILESPNLEISEGRYRIVARSNLPHIDVEVRVSHSSTLEVPPKRRIYKRSRRTNAEGLMALIPFTHLKPGVWELQCSGDLISDFFGQPWQYSLQLQVLPQQRELTEISTIEKEDAIINQPVSPVWLQAETAEQILQQLVELALPSSESFSTDETAKDSPSILPEQPLLLTLEQETYIARWGQVFSMSGCVQPQETSTEQRFLAGEVRIELRSPQSLEILAQVSQNLPEKLLPFSIQGSVEIPIDCESKLILGEISLYGKLATDDEIKLLASQSFTITADITQLLASNTPQPAPIPSSEATPESSVNLGLELFNIVKFKKITQSPFVRRSSKILPPQLNCGHKSATLQSLQLPKLPQKQTNTAVAVAEFPTQIQPVELEKEDYIATTELTINTDITAIVVAKHSTQLQRFPKEVSFAIVKRRVKKDTIFPFLRRINLASATHHPVSDREEITNNAPNILDSHQSHTTAVIDNTPQLSTSDDAQSPDDSLDDSVAVVVQRSSELLTVQTSNMSPLIRKWMQSHGYSLPEPIDVEYEDYDTSIPAHEEDTEMQRRTDAECDTFQYLRSNSEESGFIRSEERSSSLSESRGFIRPLQQEIPQQQALPPISTETPDLEIEANEHLIPVETHPSVSESTETEDQENIEKFPLSPSSPVSPSPPLPLPPPPFSIRQIKTPPTLLAKEIVVDDTDNLEEINVQDNQSSQPESVSVQEIIEPLPSPQLYVPEGELISGRFVRLRIQIDSVRYDTAIKLWAEDYQTRWLLDGPRLLTNLLPTAQGLEVTTQIHIPLDCLEIRIEAIAIDTATQQESHKASVVRTVIPQDLPTLQIDELLSM